MIQSTTYRDLRGRDILLADLDEEERQLIRRLKKKAAQEPDWIEFDAFRLKTVGDFYADRGKSRRETTRTPVWRIARDLSSRLAIAQGYARAPDYRDELEDLIRERFKSCREFCRATGLSEDMLSHVLARRKHLGLETLTNALARIGYTLQIVPLEEDSSAETIASRE